MLGLFKKKLPHCDVLFERYFSPWYPELDRPKMTRPDMYQIAAYQGEPLTFEEMQYLSTEHLAHTKNFIGETMTDAALKDFQSIIKSEELTFDVLDAVDKYYNRAKVADLLKSSDPADFSNEYLVTVCEFGVMLGYLFNQIEGFDLLYSDPYFHSIVVHRVTGYGITVFDWAIKKFSEYGVDDGHVAKFHAALDGISSNFENDED